MRLTTASTVCVLAACSLPAVAAAAPALLWEHVHDGGGLYQDRALAALVDPGGDLVVGGESYDGVVGADILIRKLARADGGVIWSRRLPSADGNDMALSELIWEPGGDLIAAGFVRGCPG